MSNEGSPEPPSRGVTFTTPIEREEGDVIAAEPRMTARGGVSRPALYLAYTDSVSHELPPLAPPERTEKTIWSSVLDFFVEGLSACGASFYPPAAYFNAGGEILPRQVPGANGRRVTLSLVPSSVRWTEDDHPAVNGPGMATDALVSQEIETPGRWSWLTSCREVVAAIWAHKRQERKIRQAIKALAALDDATLKELGIHDRDQIEDAVRYGSDC